MECPICALRQENDDLKSKKEAERIALGLCWIEGGMVNNESAPTVIRIDAPISDRHRRQIMNLLERIERKHSKEQ